MTEISNQYENYPQAVGGYTSEYQMPQNWPKDTLFYLKYKIHTTYGALLASINGQSAIKNKVKWLINHTPISVVIGFFQPIFITKDINIHISFAVNLYNTGNSHQARMVMRKLCIRHPESIAVWRLRAEFAILDCDTNEMKKALYSEREDKSLIQGLNSLDAESAFTLALEARLALNNLRDFDAKWLAQRALDKCENHYYALMVMGMLHQLSGDEEKAATTFLRALNHSQTIKNVSEQNFMYQVRKVYAYRNWAFTSVIKRIAAELPIKLKLEKMIPLTLFTPYHYHFDRFLFRNIIDKNSNQEEESEILEKILNQSKDSNSLCWKELLSHENFKSFVLKLENDVNRGKDDNNQNAGREIKSSPNTDRENIPMQTTDSINQSHLTNDFDQEILDFVFTEECNVLSLKKLPRCFSDATYEFILCCESDLPVVNCCNPVGYDGIIYDRAVILKLMNEGKAPLSWPINLEFNRRSLQINGKIQLEINQHIMNVWRAERDRVQILADNNVN